MVDARASDTAVTLKATDDAREDLPWQRGDKRDAARAVKQKPAKANKNINPCRAFNTAEGCSNTTCHYDHACSKCQVKSHTILTCWKEHPELKPKGKGKKGGGRSGK
jgi:hypothetical protein